MERWVDVARRGGGRGGPQATQREMKTTIRGLVRQALTCFVPKSPSLQRDTAGRLVWGEMDTNMFCPRTQKRKTLLGG